MRRLLLASASILFWSGIASAQTNSLVTVNIQDVRQDIAADLDVEETSIPVNVQLPVNVAANVCDVEESALSAQAETGNATCTAVTGVQELTQAVQVGSSGRILDDDETASGDQDRDDTLTGSVNPAREPAPGRSDPPAPGRIASPQTNAPAR